MGGPQDVSSAGRPILLMINARPPAQSVPARVHFRSGPADADGIMGAVKQPNGVAAGEILGTAPAGQQPAHESMADRHRRERHTAFVGRRRELETFRAALRDPDSFAVLYVWGPGGIGKSALLRRFGDEAVASGRAVVRMDARAIHRSPAGFLHAAQDANRPGRVLLVDTFELVQGLEAWFWDTFLPGLPADTTVVVAGRQPPDPTRRLDPEWAGSLHVLPMDDLDRADTAALLRLRGVPDTLDGELYSFTGGHPLALLLAAELAARDPEAVGGWQPHDPAIRTLLDRLVGELPSSEHRRALEICAHVFATREDLLRSVFGDRAATLFAWLRAQPFIESAPHGLHPHDLVRDLLIADLRWRDPEGWLAMHEQVRPYFIERALTAAGPELLPSQMALNYLHRHGKVMGEFITWRGQGEVYEDAYRPADRPAVLAMAERLDGASGAALVEFWLRRRPEGFLVYRSSATGAPMAFAGWLELHRADEEENATDPLVAAIWEHAMATAPPRAGTKVAVQRFVNVGGEPPTPSPVTDLIYMRGVATCLRERDLAWTYLVMPNADRWQPVLEYGGHYRLGGRLGSVFAHDWTAMPVRAWLDLLQDNLLHGTDVSRDRPQSALLSRPEFEQAVRDLLRAWRHRASVVDNPLVHTRLAGDGDIETRIDNLRRVLETAVDAVQGTQRGDKLHRTLATTFFHGVPTQEAAAERLSVPFGTYRHRLSAGIDRVVEELWRQAMEAPH
jgi:hypothetical protein